MSESIKNDTKHLITMIIVIIMGQEWVVVGGVCFVSGAAHLNVQAGKAQQAEDDICSMAQCTAWLWHWHSHPWGLSEAIGWLVGQFTVGVAIYFSGVQWFVKSGRDQIREVVLCNGSGCPILLCFTGNYMM